MRVEPPVQSSTYCEYMVNPFTWENMHEMCHDAGSVHIHYYAYYLKSLISSLEIQRATSVISDSTVSDWSWENIDKKTTVFTHRNGDKLYLFAKAQKLTVELLIEHELFEERTRIDQWVAGKMIIMFPAVLGHVMRRPSRDQAL